MKVGIVMDDGKGIDGDVSVHFGQCQYFLLADIDAEKKAVAAMSIVPNTVSHGNGGCAAVAEILKHDITHVIAGGMGMGAQAKFANAGVRVFGFSGKVKNALDQLLNDTLGEIVACKEHGGNCH